MANIFKTIDSVSLIKTLRDFALALRQFFATKSEMNAVESALTDIDNRKIEASDIPTSLPANGGNADYATSAGSASTADSVDWSGVTNKPSSFTPSSHTHTKSEITDFPTSLPANGGNADYATSAGSVAWDNVANKPSYFTPSSHQHEKIFHSKWSYENAIPDTTSPADICAQFNVDLIGKNAAFTGMVQNDYGKRYQSLFWTNYGAAGLVELAKSYGADGRLKYRVSAGWNDNGAHWSSTGYRELANVEDLTWGNIKNKPETATRWPSWSEVTNTPTSLPANGGNADYATSAGSASTADSVDWSGVTNKPSSFTPSSHTHTTSQITDFPTSLPANGGYANGITNSGVLDSQEKIDNFISGSRLKYATFSSNDNNLSFSGNDGMILSIPWHSSDYGAQMAFDDAHSCTVKVRGKSGTWGNWYTILHSGNYNSYAPKLDGTGARGTWGINISGNAASASSVDWSGVANRPTNVSQFTNDAGYITASNAKFGDYLPLSGGTVTGQLYLTGLDEGTADVTDNTELLTSYASNNGFSDTNATGKVYRRDAIKVYNYIKGKLDSVYSAIGHKHYTSDIVDFPKSLPANGGNADTLDKLHSSAFKKTWTAHAGGKNVGWVTIAKWTINTPNYFSPYPFMLSIYRDYNSPSTETYTFSITFGWDTANIVQVNGNAGTRIIEKLRIAKCSDNLTYRLEMYVNTDFTTYSNLCDCVAYGNYGDDFTFNTVDELSSDVTSTLAEITTAPNYIVGNLSGNAATASSVDWSGVTNKPSSFTPSSHTHTKSEITDFPTSLPANGGTANGIANSGMLDSQEKIDNFLTGHIFKYATFKTTDSNNLNFGSNDGMILSIPWHSSDYGAQMAFDDTQTATVKVRGKSGTWGNWYTILHSGNYNSYAPKLDGTGARGTWGINISGNADTVDNMHASDFATAGHTHSYIPINSPSSPLGGGGWGQYVFRQDVNEEKTIASENGAPVDIQHRTQFKVMRASDTWALTFGVKEGLGWIDCVAMGIGYGDIYLNPAGKHVIVGNYNGAWYPFSRNNRLEKLIVFGEQYTSSTIESGGGFIKTDSSNDYVLLGGGGHKAESSLSVNYAASAGDADRLDGIDSTEFLRKVTVANNTENDFNTFSNMTLTGRGDPTTGASLKNAPWTGAGPAGGYGVLTYLWYGYGTQMAWGYGSDRIYIRHKHYYNNGSNWSSTWNSLALTSDIPSSLPANGGNADYATSAGSASTADSVDWSGVANKPTNVSQFTNDAGYITASNAKFDNYLPLSGGTVTGQIAGNDKGGSWIYGRLHAALYQKRNNENDWHPVVGFKTKTGSWEFGSVGNTDLASFSWGSDSDFNSGNNSTTVVNLRNVGGTIALTSEIPTSLPANGGYANGITNSGVLDSQEKIDNFISGSRLKYATFSSNDNNLSFSGNDGMILSIPWHSSDYGAQMAFDDAHSCTVKVRGKSSTWGNWYTILHSGNYNSYAPKLDGTGARGTWGINISGNAATASSVDWSGVANRPTSLPANGGNADTARDATLHNGYTIVQTNGLTSTIRNFTLGTLVRTSIDYSVTHGDPFYVEIKGNTYANALNSCFTQIQGYIYDDTIIAYGVTHLGVLKITPITAMNLDGKLCFWFPRLGYWMGFDIKCYNGYNYAINTVTSIENSADPGGTKRVTLTEQEITSYHSGNLTSSVIGNLGTLSNDISGNAATASSVDWSGVTNSPTSLPANGGNADTATKLQTARTLTIGNTGKSFDGSSDVSWSLSEIGAASSSHTHPYLPLSGGTMTGLLTATSSGNHKGVKVGNTYINAINGELIFQNNSAIRFGGDSWDYNVWAGLKYEPSLKIISLGLADGSAFTANSAQSGGKLYLPGIDNIYTGNGTNIVWHAGNDGSGSGLDADKLDGKHASEFMLKSEHAGDMYETNDAGADFCEAVIVWQMRPNTSYEFADFMRVPVPSTDAMDKLAHCIKQTEDITLGVGEKIIKQTYTWSQMHWSLQCSRKESVVYTTKYVTEDAVFPSVDYNGNTQFPPTTIDISVSYNQSTGVRHVHITIENMYGRAYYDSSKVNSK